MINEPRYIKTFGQWRVGETRNPIGRVQKIYFPPLPTGFSTFGIKEPQYEERKRCHRNSSSVSQTTAVQAQTSASCCRTPSDCSDRILRHCGRFKNSSNRVPVRKTVMGKNKTLIPEVKWHKGSHILAGLYPNNVQKTSHHDLLVTMQRYDKVSEAPNSVNENLTFGLNDEILDCRNNAVKFNVLSHNALCATRLAHFTTLFVVLNVVGSSPTGHPTIKPVDYQVISGLFCVQNQARPP